MHTVIVRKNFQFLRSHPDKIKGMNAKVALSKYQP
jgi:hypothetical protein